MTGLLAVPLIGVCALAVDVGIWQMNKSAMQGAADQALLAAGLAKAAGGSAENEARGMAAAHGFVHGSVDQNNRKTTVTVGVPTAGTYAGDANALEVLITQPQQTFLSGVIAGFSAPVASARAVGVGNPKIKVCVLMLKSSGVDISVSGGGVLRLNDCGLSTNTTSPCGMSLSGAATWLIAPDIFLSGTAGCTSGGATISGTQRVNSPPVLDPYRFRAIPVPVPGCTPIIEYSGTKNIGPGTYCSISLSNSAKLRFTSPGIYIIDGGSIDLSGDSEITGDSVTLVLTSRSATYGSVTMSSNSKINITTRKSGPTAGMGIWIDKRANTNVIISNNSKINSTGAIYAPNANIIVGNNAEISAIPCGQLIAKEISSSSSSLASLNIAQNCDGYGIESAFSGDGALALKE